MPISEQERAKREKVESIKIYSLSPGEHISYLRLQLIARRVGWPSEEEETHLVVCSECRDKIEKMRKATLGI